MHAVWCDVMVIYICIDVPEDAWLWCTEYYANF